MTKYWTLLCREGVDNPWTVQFGDYTRKSVAEEYDEFRRDYKNSDLKIIMTGDTQDEINKAVVELNK